MLPPRPTASLTAAAAGFRWHQVDFSYQEDSYTLRALKSGESADISGLYADWGEALEWQSGQLSIQYNSTDGMGWIGWYDGETQWCLSAGDGADAPLVNTAYSTMQTLGYDVDVAPEGASDAVYSAEPRDGLAVASCAFTLDGVRGRIPWRPPVRWSCLFQDISGLPDYAVTEDTKILWCPAVISYDESGAGKITWFDVAPGLVYSLSADSRCQPGRPAGHGQPPVHSRAGRGGMSHLHIVPAMMPMESAPFCASTFPVCPPNSENRLGNERELFQHAETPPDRAAFFHAKSEDAPSKTTARTGGSSICQALAKKV